jgi:hypothetical protein
MIQKLYVYVSLDPGSDATAYRRPDASGSWYKAALKGFCVDDRGLADALEKMNRRTPIAGRTGNQVAVILGYPKGSTLDGYDLFEPDSVFISAGTINFLTIDDVQRFFQEELIRTKKDFKL